MIRQNHKKLFSFAFSKKECGTRTEYKIFGVKFRKTKRDKVIAVLRLNGLGDYILMHNFLSYIKQSKKYKDYKLMVITWNHFSSLVDDINSSCVDEFIWIDFILNKPWGLKFLKKKFSRYKFDTILSPVISDFAETEKILSLIKAKNVIGQECLEEEPCSKTKKLYTELIKPSSEHISEFERNKYFFEKVLNLKIDIEKPCFKHYIDSDEKYVLFSPFAEDPQRTWSRENFANTINYVIEKYNYKCIILGSRLDTKAALEITSKIKPENKNFVINAIGKIATVDLPRILKNNAKLLIANETGTVHIAAAVNCPFLVISNARFYKRFQPYKGFEDSYIYPPKFQTLLKTNQDVSFYYNQTDLDVNEITLKDLIPKIDNMLKKNC